MISGRVHWFVATVLVSSLTGCGALATHRDVAGHETKKPPLMTWVEMRDRYTVKQQLDYSCGAAALATLLHYFYGDDLGELDILKDILKHLDKEAVKNRAQVGFSMLDLKRFVERHGYKALGVKLQASALPKLRGPVLVYLETADFRHFAMLRGVREDRVYLADPSRGNMRMSIYAFLEEWPGYVLVVNKPGFNLPENYPGMITEEVPIRQEFNAVRNALSRGQSNDISYSRLGF
ncbi:MAG: C39 family peptidase [Gammaproteobacteria bacterium]